MIARKLVLVRGLVDLGGIDRMRLDADAREQFEPPRAGRGEDKSRSGPRPRNLAHLKR